jgi:hypothetical protein
MDEQFESMRFRMSYIENHPVGLHADVAIIHGRMEMPEVMVHQ